MKLYHGSNMEIDVPDLKKGRRGKDFGQGFYLSDNLQQALDMAASVSDREKSGVPTVTVFEFDETLLRSSEYQVQVFNGYSLPWVKFIRANRSNRSLQQIHDFDIVYGPIANDTVGYQLRRCDLSIITEEQLLEELKYKTCTFQYFFGTEKALANLKKVETI